MSVGPSRHRLLPRAGTSATEFGLTCTSFMRTVPLPSGRTRKISRSRDHLTGGAPCSGRLGLSPAQSL
uniref:Neurensin 1 n=1 Tax=Molossus molossus TaxID=27622 RepID=A0A7J8FA76_MOLMO|nr:neurensin 1 [Molossus molossus]